MYKLGLLFSLWLSVCRIDRNFGVDVLRRRDISIRLSMLSNILQFCNSAFRLDSNSILLNVSLLVGLVREFWSQQMCLNFGVAYS